MEETEETGVKSYCPRCKVFENRDGDYCSSCGEGLTVAPLPGKCPKCHHEVRAADRYCKNCGTILKADKIPAVPDSPMEIPNLPVPPKLPAKPKLPGGSSKLRVYVTEVEVIGPECGRR